MTYSGKTDWQATDTVVPADVNRWEQGIVDATIKSYTATIGTAWVGSSAPFTQDVAVLGVLATDNVIVGLIKSDTYATALLQITEYSKIYRAVTSADKITFYADAPTSSTLSIQIKTVK